jgi:quercetin dioxygenase-like cupin family protein
MRFLITGEETGGAFFMAEITVPPGGGPPPHVHHREDESFFLQQGTLMIQVGDKTLSASPGDFVHLPRGIVHSFRNTAQEPAKMLVTCTPAGLENFFAEVFYPAVEGHEAPMVTEALMMRMMAAAPRYGLELHPPAH